MENTNSIYEDIILFQKYNPKKNAINTLKNLLKRKIDSIDPSIITNNKIVKLEDEFFKDEKLNETVLQYLLSNNLSKQIYESFDKENGSTELLYLPFGFDTMIDVKDEKLKKQFGNYDLDEL